MPGVTQAGPIDLGGPVGRLLHRRPLKNNTVMQSIGVDPVSGDVYTLQIMEGGLRLPDESASLDWLTRKKQGDLCLTRLNPAGAVTGHMYLRGFGHGVNLGVENRGGAVHLWTETASLPNRSSEGYGSAVTSFAFASGTVLDFGSSRHTPPYTPDPAARFVTPTIDRGANELVLRFTLDGATHWERYDLARATAGDWVPLQRITPQIPSDGEDFQGYASHDGVLYTLKGQPLVKAPLPGNTYLSVFDWATGALIAHQHITAGPGLEYREPEGLTVVVRDGTPHLLFGFACEDTGPRTCTIMSLSGAPETDGVKVLTDWLPIPLAAGVTVDTHPPRGRVISLAGTTVLQLSGTLKGSFDQDAVLGTLPDALTPTVTARCSVPRNHTGGVSVARVEAGSDRLLRLYGGRAENAVTWVQLDSFSAVWS
ncbi:hypothetical protein ACFY8P_06205 [Streptomyces sp. NPDC012693]|uniref:phage baseplate protein n=1 Tax=Streptomyces sp. NPDC012693 TaxID=3364844 RepID=UPI00367AEA6F